MWMSEYKLKDCKEGKNWITQLSVPKDGCQRVYVSLYFSLLHLREEKWSLSFDSFDHTWDCRSAGPTSLYHKAWIISWELTSTTSIRENASRISGESEVEIVSLTDIGTCFLHFLRFKLFKKRRLCNAVVQCPEFWVTCP